MDCKRKVNCVDALPVSKFNSSYPVKLHGGGIFIATAGFCRKFFLCGMYDKPV